MNDIHVFGRIFLAATKVHNTLYACINENKWYNNNHTVNTLHNLQYNTPFFYTHSYCTRITPSFSHQVLNIRVC